MTCPDLSREETAPTTFEPHVSLQVGREDSLTLYDDIH